MISARTVARRCSACLALAALLLQLALSFAHVHKHDLALSGLGRSSVVSVRLGPWTQQTAEQSPARLADDDDDCLICFSGFLLSNSSLPDAAANTRPLQFSGIDHAFKPVFDRVFHPRHPAFQSRAPPSSVV